MVGVDTRLLGRRKLKHMLLGLRRLLHLVILLLLLSLLLANLLLVDAHCSVSVGPRAQHHSLTMRQPVRRRSSCSGSSSYGRCVPSIHAGPSNLAGQLCGQMKLICGQMALVGIVRHGALRYLSSVGGRV